MKINQAIRSRPIGLTSWLLRSAESSSWILRPHPVLYGVFGMSIVGRSGSFPSRDLAGSQPNASTAGAAR